VQGSPRIHLLRADRFAVTATLRAMNSANRHLAISLAALATLTCIAAPGSASATSDATWQRSATYPVYLNRPSGEAATAASVAEISDVSADGKTLIYTDALGKRIGFLDITDPSTPVGAGTLSLAELGDSDDQPTSVAVSGDYVLVVVDTSTSFTSPTGRLDVIRITDRTRVKSIDLGGQPDSIDISPDGAWGAIAIENERDETANSGNLPQAPAGFVQIIDLASGAQNATVTPLELPQETLSAAGVTEPSDPEPEYVAINAANQLALTLQENNAIVIADLATATITKVFSAGTVTVTGVDAKKDAKIAPTDTLSDLPREPDAIAWVDATHVATANEGDWKGGTRGWTIFEATTGNVTWDAGNSVENLAISYGLHNEDRAAKKGVELEGLAVAEIGGKKLAFVGSERSNFVAVYDLSNPAAPAFRQLLPTTNGPEGILAIPSRNLLAISSETDDASKLVRASVSLFTLAAGESNFPSIVSNTATDLTANPLGWGALGALSAVPGDAQRLYAATDVVNQPSQIYTVDVSQHPATVTTALTVTNADGTGAALDIEGLLARPAGGFWVANEGATGAANSLVQLDASGKTLTTVSLPSEISAGLTKWGFEGVTATTDADGEHLFTVLQRPLYLDGAWQSTARIGRYDVADGTWHWFGYPLETTSVSGDWLGLSEIAAIDADTFAVIERDKLNGPDAAVKRIYTVDIPVGATGVTDATPAPALAKTLAKDMLPVLRATHGWTQEKLEGLTIGADHNVYTVTDNDGLKDATGETVFSRLGSKYDVFSLTPPASATPSASPTPTHTAQPTPTPKPVVKVSSKVRIKAKDQRLKRGKMVTITVTVDTSRAANPTGIVQLVYRKSTVVASATLKGGKATVKYKPRKTGVKQFFVRYLGDSVSSPAASKTIRVRIVR
jgi:hypothetical protein